ncbi:MAG: UvrD-helicase domain-containing protein [Bacteroidota bacterium]|nr:UvrD-helicase domain-containing protein [Bacteroidota bacterium]
MSTQLTRDTGLRFPDFTVCGASAGTGKTFTLTERFLQLIISERIDRNSLLNILAITFTNNAAAEMKQRIIESLKMVSLGVEEKLQAVAEIVEMDKEKLRGKSEELLALILDNYSDFQVKTIDSFMASVFKATALEYGYHPEFEIGVSDTQLLNYALDVFTRQLRPGSAESQLFQQLVRLIEEQRYSRDSFLWNPYARISSEMLKLYRISARKGMDVIVQGAAGETQAKIREALAAKSKQLQGFLNSTGLPVSKRFLNDLRAVEEGSLDTVLNRGEKGSIINALQTNAEKQNYAGLSVRIEHELAEWNELLRKYLVASSYSHYLPYAQAIEEVKKTVEEVKRDVGEVSLADVARELLKEVNDEHVPEIYFTLGETIYHFLIDEFQDTSPVQWKILKPLIENSLSQGGSLFMVGDIKQSVYTFRGADWRIMSSVLRENPFPAAPVNQLLLTTNYRSCERISQFVFDVFAKTIPAMGNEYADAVHVSGLSDVTIDVLEENRGKGYVEAVPCERNDELQPEKQKILDVIRDCRERGYAWRDIAVLSLRNNDVVTVSSWLNEKNIPFVSHSSLDIRKRKTIGGIVALLRFLDSPIDDFSFSVFLLSEIYGRAVASMQDQSPGISFENLIFTYNTAQTGYSVLYRYFQSNYPGLWKSHFATLFSRVGYLPLYDLVAEVCRVFDIFSLCKEEEAAIIKLLEVVKRFEEHGSPAFGDAGNSLRDFLEFVDVDDDSDVSEWELDAPKDIDAVSAMTVHKAKGLGFPVVIVLLYDTTQRGRGYIARETSSGLALVRVRKKDGERSEELQALYDEQSLDDCVDYLNRLYVAFTRAKVEMYVISVYTAEKKIPSSFFPLEEYAPADRPQAIVTPPHVGLSRQTYHHTAGQRVAVTEADKLGIAETRRGDCFHLLLSRIGFLSPKDVQDNDIATAIDSLLPDAVRESGTFSSSSEIRQSLLGFFAQTNVGKFFERRGERTILNEQEFVRADGSLFRMDRIVADADAVTIIDYKTGSDEKQGEYIEQVKNYIKILSDFFPKKKIKGMLAYIDMKKLVEME